MKLEDAPRLLHRMVVVRRGAVAVKPEPLVFKGGWHGVISNITPTYKKDDEVVTLVDYILEIKLECGTAREDWKIELPFTSDLWRLRFPWKGEEEKGRKS